MPTFVVERYWPGVSIGAAERVMTREASVARDMNHEGTAIRVVRSTLVQDDETVLSLVEADSEQDVAELARRSGVRADRIVPAQDVLPAGHDADDGTL